MHLMMLDLQWAFLSMIPVVVDRLLARLKILDILCYNHIIYSMILLCTLKIWIFTSSLDISCIKVVSEGGGAATFVKEKKIGNV